MPDKKKKTKTAKTQQSSEKLNKLQDSDDDDRDDGFVPLAQVKKQKKSKTQIVEKLPELSETAIDNSLSNVVYVGHLPHGFYETELKKFFEQFGQVTRVSVNRNPKTLRPRHFAFVEFEDQEIAATATEAMHGYIMFHKRLICRHVPVHLVKTFKSRNDVTVRLNPNITKNIDAHKAALSVKKIKKIQARLQKKEELKHKKLQDLSVDYTFPTTQTEETLPLIQ
jgi:nucleolar protein 15